LIQAIYFGNDISLDGNRLAVSSYAMDGSGNTQSASGEVLLFSFTDAVFSGGVLESRIGLGYTGGKNIDNSVHLGLRMITSAGRLLWMEAALQSEPCMTMLMETHQAIVELFIFTALLTLFSAEEFLKRVWATTMLYSVERTCPVRTKPQAETILAVRYLLMEIVW
jgi:hypothetical protein